MAKPAQLTAGASPHSPCMAGRRPHGRPGKREKLPKEKSSRSGQVTRFRKQTECLGDAASGLTATSETYPQRAGPTGSEYRSQQGGPRAARPAVSIEGRRGAGDCHSSTCGLAPPKDPWIPACCPTPWLPGRGPSQPLPLPHRTLVPALTLTPQPSAGAGALSPPPRPLPCSGPRQPAASPRYGDEGSASPGMEGTSD